MEITLPEYFMDYPDGVLSEAVMNVIRMENCCRQFDTDRITDDMRMMRDRLNAIKATQRLRFTKKGRNKDIGESIERLLDMGLIDESDIHNALFTWENKFQQDWYGVCYPSLRIVAINPFLDYSIVSQQTFDKVVYHEILHLRQDNLGIGGKNPHDEQFMQWERQYPFYDFAENELSPLSFELEMVSDMENPPKDIRPDWSYIEDDYLEGADVFIDPIPTDELKSFFPSPILGDNVVNLVFDSTGSRYYHVGRVYERHTCRTGLCITLDPRLRSSTPEMITAIRSDIEHHIRTSEGSQDQTILDFLCGMPVSGLCGNDGEVTHGA